jgi:hypothetical protein
MWRAFLCLLGWVAPLAAGPDQLPPPDAPEPEAKAALQRFAAEYRRKDPKARLEAIEHLGGVVHPTVADRLARTLRRLKDPAQIAAACRGLARQKSAAAESGAAVSGFLMDHAEEEGKRAARGDFGIPIDPKTGDLVLDTAESRAAMETAQARATMFHEALKALEALDYYDPADVEPLSGFLQSFDDALVAAVLGAFARWKAWHALPAMLDLYRMYPSPNRWETGSVVHRDGTNATAKRAWMAKFGHPNKQRPRPELVNALVGALEAITGEKFKTPDDLAAFLDRPDVQANIAKSERKRAVAIDPRRSIRDAQKGMRGVSFEDLSAEDRDRLFADLSRHDHPDAVQGLADAIAKFGEHADVITARVGKILEVLKPLEAKSGLTGDEAFRRQANEAELGTWADKERLARATLDRVAASVGRFEEAKTVERVLSVFARHSSWQVRWVFAEAATRWYGAPLDEALASKVLAALVALGKDPVPLVRIASARSLGASRDPAAVAPLRDLSTRDADWRVRAAAVLALGDTGGPEAITALIEAMATAEGRLLDDINATLFRVTGWNLVYPEVWAQSWRDAKGEAPAPPKDPPPAAQEVKHAQRFYGITTRSKRVLYIVDISGSMLKETKEPGDRSVGDKDKLHRTRWDVAQEELKRAIGGLVPDATFSIVFFNHSVQVWERELQKATPEARRLANEAIRGAEPKGATFTLGALREAFAVAGLLGSDGAARNGGALVDTIFLLSDGAPTDSQLDGAKLMDPAILLEAVDCWNRDRAIVIHTIAIDVMDNRFLRELAARNGGQFVERK